MQLLTRHRHIHSSEEWSWESDESEGAGSAAVCSKSLATSAPTRPGDASCHSRALPRTGGLDDTLHTIIDYACEQNIPFVFALNRKALGRSLNKAVPVSVVGIFSYDGAQVSGSRLLLGGGGHGVLPDSPAAPQPQGPWFP